MGLPEKKGIWTDGASKLAIKKGVFGPPWSQSAHKTYKPSRRCVYDASEASFWNGIEGAMSLSEKITWCKNLLEKASEQNERAFGIEQGSTVTHFSVILRF